MRNPIRLTKSKAFGRAMHMPNRSLGVFPTIYINTKNKITKKLYNSKFDEDPYMDHISSSKDLIFPPRSPSLRNEEEPSIIQMGKRITNLYVVYSN